MNWNELVNCDYPSPHWPLVVAVGAVVVEFFPSTMAFSGGGDVAPVEAPLKKGYTSYLRKQLLEITWPPCFPLQQDDSFSIELSRQSLQSSLDKSLVHCTSPYIFWRLETTASPVANIWLEENAASDEMLSINCPSMVLKRIGSDALMVFSKDNSFFNVTEEKKFWLEYLRRHSSYHIVLSLLLLQRCNSSWLASLMQIWQSLLVSSPLQRTRPKTSSGVLPEVVL